MMTTSFSSPPPPLHPPQSNSRSQLLFSSSHLKPTPRLLLHSCSTQQQQRTCSCRRLCSKANLIAAGLHEGFSDLRDKLFSTLVLKKRDLVYSLSKVGQAIDNNDLPAAGLVLGNGSDTEWVKTANLAFTKLSASPEENTEVETFNSSLASLVTSVNKNDLDSSKLAFVSSASALEKWSSLTATTSSCNHHHRTYVEGYISHADKAAGR